MISLIDNYFKIDGFTANGNEAQFDITLLPDYCVYEGHFPDNPVSPGVCNIQMIKECAEQFAGKRFFLGYISRCKLTAVITPQTTPRLRVQITLSEAGGLYDIKAVVSAADTTFIELRGELSVAE